MRGNLLVLSCVALIVGACSSDDNSDSTTAGPATTTATSSANGMPPELDADGRVLVAETVNDFVLDTVVAYGEDGLDPQAIATAVTDMYPSLSLAGSAIVADGSNISFMSNAVNDKDVASADNPLFVAVATMQASGECFGAAVYGYPLPTERFEVTDELPECSAQAVWAALGAELS